MKLTKSKLQRLVKEELNTALKEYGIGGPFRVDSGRGGISDSETPEEFVKHIYRYLDDWSKWYQESGNPRDERALINQLDSGTLRNILNTGGMLANPTGFDPRPAAGMGPALHKFMSRVDPKLQKDRDVQSVEQTTFRKLDH